MEQIEQKGFVLEIHEYQDKVRQYHDKDKERFMRTSKQLINEHLERHCNQNGDEVKNTTIRLYTY